jgi:hypothetical protein
LIPQTGRRARHLDGLNLYKSCVPCPCAYLRVLGLPITFLTAQSTAPTTCIRTRRLAVCPIIPLCVVTTRLAAATDILRLRRVSGCLGTLPGSSHGSPRRSYSTTSLISCVRVPRHVARLVARLVVDFFVYVVRPGASAHHAACRVARRRLLRLHRASGCLGTSRGSSRGSSSTTSTTPRIRGPRHVAWLVVDYFVYARLGASARRAARRRLLHLRRASGCLRTSRGLSRASSSTTSPTPRVWVPRHVAWFISPLVFD